MTRALKNANGDVGTFDFQRKLMHWRQIELLLLDFFVEVQNAKFLLCHGAQDVNGYALLFFCANVHEKYLVAFVGTQLNM